MMLTQVEYLDYMARTTQSVHHQDEVGGRGGQQQSIRALTAIVLAPDRPALTLSAPLNHTHTHSFPS